MFMKDATNLDTKIQTNLTSKLEEESIIKKTFETLSGRIQFRLSFICIGS